MQEILLNTFSGDKVEVSIVRYFEAEGKKYLVYTLNEKDADNYLRLYVGAVTTQVGRTEINIISDENEWANVKALFKGIIAANREGRPVPVRDLSANELTVATLNSYRVFKLLADMANILGENKNDNTSNGEQTTMERPRPVFSFENMAPYNSMEAEAPVEPSVDSVMPSYNEPVVESSEPMVSELEAAETYEMPIPTPSVMEFNPEPTIEPVSEDNDSEEETIQERLDAALEQINELTLENVQLSTKLEAIRMILK